MAAYGVMQDQKCVLTLSPNGNVLFCHACSEPSTSLVQVSTVTLKAQVHTPPFLCWLQIHCIHQSSKEGLLICKRYWRGIIARTPGQSRNSRQESPNWKRRGGGGSVGYLVVSAPFTTLFLDKVWKATLPRRSFHFLAVFWHSQGGPG